MTGINFLSISKPNESNNKNVIFPFKTGANTEYFKSWDCSKLNLGVFRVKGTFGELARISHVAPSSIVLSGITMNFYGVWHMDLY